MARTYRFIVGFKEDRLRLDRYLVGRLPQSVSRAAVQRAIAAGAVTVGGDVAKPHRLVKIWDTVVARLDQVPRPSTGTTIRPEPIPLEIVYEDDQLLVVNKPAGLVTHPAPGHWSGTLVNAIAWHLSKGQGAGGVGRGNFPEPVPPVSRPVPLPRMGLVHRLDKDTSGLLVVAKTDVALTRLAGQLKDRTMSRRYLALVDGHVALNEGTVDAAIGRHLKDRKLMAVRYLGGRQAVTHYRVLKRFGEGARGRRQGAREPSSHAPRPVPPYVLPYTLLEVWLETGRTHQIRVHVAHLGHPVLGDPVYSHHPASDWHGLGITRQLLHAYAIRFLHPTTNQPLRYQIGAPEDMNRWVAGYDLKAVLAEGGKRP